MSQLFIGIWSHQKENPDKYLAPEVLNPRKQSVKTDVYSLAIIMAEFLDVDFNE